MAEMPSQTAERVHLQWNEGWHTWQEVLPQYARKRGVVTFIRADLVDDIVKACRMASGTGVHIGRGEYSISQEAMQAIDVALTRIKGDVT